MKKRKRIWMISMVLAITAAHGTILAEAQETEGSVEAITQTTEDGTELDTKILMETVKKTADGQTLLDVSKGNITIKSSGATGGGYKQ
ncbi:hypothetical protein K290105B7_05570 [Anaerostipes caccae]|uniref:hypothetical protein n=1 Tax=Anaerostipes caccae TaxID=105841 RepID=UPI0006C7B97C|nr:hypothetical protein [Anaerostipes caccae]